METFHFNDSQENHYAMSEAVLKLKVTDEQNEAEFIAPNVRSIAEAYLYRKAGDVLPYAVQDGEAVVEFVMLEEDEKEEELMI